MVDRLLHIDNVTGKETLLVELDDILKHSPDQYIELQKAQNHGFNNIPDEWKPYYDPITNIDEKIYKKIMNCPTTEE